MEEKVNEEEERMRMHDVMEEELDSKNIKEYLK